MRNMAAAHLQCVLEWNALLFQLCTHEALRVRSIVSTDLWSAKLTNGEGADILPGCINRTEIGPQCSDWTQLSQPERNSFMYFYAAVNSGQENVSSPSLVVRSPFDFYGLLAASVHTISFW
ncbi:unnamed protein product [Ranitomeya imitator]|uniref:Uncharacterized protein n=1 Tax=Ranitomeya imitator TaxID=111125 RepID=A0ABN9LAM3_9NEOB|nr:unnamed protein product [Ranitomeya imitator]